MTKHLTLQPPSLLLAGPSGSGKTSSIATQLLCGLEVFVIMTEADGVASLLDAAERLNAPIDNLHWTSCLPASAGWGALEDMIIKVNSMDQKGIADLRDLGKSGFKAPAMKFLNAFRNFTCERTGEVFGDVTTWDDTRSLVIDSLTGWSMIAWGATVGYKPTANQGEWGIAQNFIFNWLVKVQTDRKCYFTLTSHVEKENDDMSGVRKVMVSTIGAKLAPKIPPFFSEVVRSTRSIDPKGGAEFTWSTLDSTMDLKNRALPINSKFPADFRPIFDAHQRRKTLAGYQTEIPALHQPATPAVLRMPPAPMGRTPPKAAG